MVTIKLKFRPMDTKKHFGQIDIAISNGCVTRQIVTPHCVRSSEFDRKRCRLIVPADVRRRAEIVSMRDELDHNRPACAGLLPAWKTKGATVRPTMWPMNTWRS